ncbi:MAG: PHB depolymerase family esterase [Gemmatimonadota bacterium]
MKDAKATVELPIRREVGPLGPQLAPALRRSKGIRANRGFWMLPVALMAAACGDDSSPTEPQQPPELGPGDSRGAFTLDGFDRKYLQHVPPQHDPQQPSPLLIFFHGFQSSGAEFQAITGLDDIADDEGIVVLYPEGVSGSWAAACDCTTADALGVDDVAFVDALIAEVGKSLAVDSKRIYAAGFSQGAQFIHHLACVYADRLAAVASVGATMATVVAQRCQPARPLPFTFIQGTDDPSFPWGGAAGVLISLNETVGKWVDLNGCSTKVEALEPDTDTNDGTVVRTESYSDCDQGAEVILYSVERGGHTWPSSLVHFPEERFGLTTGDISGRRVIIDFFTRFSLP